MSYDRAGTGNANYRHGHCVGGPSKLYYIHKEMVRRCTDPTYKRYADYGGRGITVDPKWIGNLQAFIDDIGPRPTPRHSVDRKDNNAGYSKENCRWATQLEQNNNTRVNRPITANGRTQNLSQWAHELGRSPSSLHWRLTAGWSEEATINTPFKASRSTKSG